MNPDTEILYAQVPEREDEMEISPLEILLLNDQADLGITEYAEIYKVGGNPDIGPHDCLDFLVYRKGVKTCFRCGSEWHEVGKAGQA